VKELSRLSATRTTRDNRAINTIRAAAALMVVLEHVRHLFFQDYADGPHSAGLALAYVVTSLGSGAVIVFFVLSGFWVGGGAVAKIRAGRFSWAGYASSRLTRLWLVLVPALLLTFVTDSVGQRMRPASSNIYMRWETSIPDLAHITHSFGDLLGNMLFLQSIHVQEFGSNKALWSLAYEFWYYLIFPAAVLAFMATRTWRVRFVAAGLALAAAVIAGPTVLLLFPAWLMGAAVASQRDWIVKAIRRAPRRKLAASRAAATFGTLGAMVLVRGTPLPAAAGSIAIAIPMSVLLALLTVDLEWRRPYAGMLNGGSWLARSSYSLYATHAPIAVLLCGFAVPEISQRWPMDAPHVAIGLCIVTLLVLIGIGFAAITESRTESVRKVLRKFGRSHSNATANT
jgi:peptidoglycan/LPS O-acetylase OafA/YrhL